jgi:hypothetical protein
MNNLITPAEKKAFEKEFGTYWGDFRTYQDFRDSHSQKAAFAAMRILQDTGNMAKAKDSLEAVES